MRVRSGRLFREQGSIAPLGIGLAMLSLAVVLVFTSASSLFLLQRRLTSLAESIALSEARYDLPPEVFLSKSGGHGFRDLRISLNEVRDGLTREVKVCSTWQSPVPTFTETVTIEVCGRGLARAG